jgi:hypothetical protein
MWVWSKPGRFSKLLKRSSGTSVSLVATFSIALDSLSLTLFECSNQPLFTVTVLYVAFLLALLAEDVVALSSQAKCLLVEAWRVRRAARTHGAPHSGCPAATHAPARKTAGFRSLGPTLPQKVSLLGGCTLNHINHACPPSPHNVGLFPTPSPLHFQFHHLRLELHLNLMLTTLMNVKF